MSNQPLSDVRTLPEAQAVRVDQACDRFEAAWQAGERPQLEEYLAEVPAAEQALFLAELIPLDIGYRQRRGEAPQTTEYRERFPGLDPAWLARQFEAEAAAGAAGPLPALPGYQVLGVLGHGGMGVVYKAWQHALKRVVALKMIKAEGVASAEQLARFRTEADAVARLQHPSIVHIYDVGQQDSLPYFTMEFVDGGSLDKQLQGTPQPAPEAAQLVETLARAMHYAHEHGVVHRDLKPANVLLTAEGTPKITDFGLAKLLSGSGREQTQSGAILGTPPYMAPEQAGGPRQAIGPAVDVYALGALLYELLTGRPPFKGETPLETLAQVCTQEPVPPGQLQPKVPRDLETICLKCLHKEPAKRYASALALAEDLRRFLQGEPIRARPVGRLERLGRWCRRNPALASLTAALVLVFLAGFAGVTWKWRQVEEQNEKLEWNLYLHRIALAHGELLAQNVGRAEQLLDECPADQRSWEWHYLKGLSRRNVLTLKELPGRVWCIALSPDGKRLATANPDGGKDEPAVRVWDTTTGKELFGSHGPTGRASVAFSPDGRLLASGGRDGSIQLLEAATGQELLTLRGQTEAIPSVAFSPDSQRLASASEKGLLKIWDLTTGQELLTWPGHGARISTVVYSPDGRRLASASSDETVRIWDATTGREIHTLPGDRSVVWGVAYSPDGKRLASAHYSGAARVWDATTGQERQTFFGHVGGVCCVAFTPDGRRVATAGWDQTVKLWDPTTGQEVLTLRGHGDFLWCNALTFNREGLLATASVDRTAKLWDGTPLNAADDQEVRTFRKHADLVSRVAFSPTGEWLASGSWDGSVRIWDARTGQDVVRLRGHEGQVWDVAFSPDGRYLASGGFDKAVRVWDASTGAAVRTLDAGALVFGLAFSPDSQRLAAGFNPGAVKVWETTTWQHTLTAGPTSRGFRVCFSPDSQRLALGYEDKSVGVWDARTGEPLSKLPGHVRRVYGVAFSPDGKRLVSTSFDGTIKVWDLEAGAELVTLPDHKDPVVSIAYSPDGRYLASGCSDGSVKLWDARTLREVRTLRGHIGYVFGVAFSPDSKQLASSSGHHGRGEVKIWDLTVLKLDPQRDRRADRGQRFMEHPKSIQGVVAHDWAAALNQGRRGRFRIRRWFLADVSRAKVSANSAVYR